MGTAPRRRLRLGCSLRYRENPWPKFWQDGSERVIPHSPRGALPRTLVVGNGTRFNKHTFPISMSPPMKHNHNHNNAPNAELQLVPVHFTFTHPTATTVC